jgi:death on curing protein
MPPTVFLTVDVVLQVHQRSIEEFGGDTGLRDRGLLESAVAMPQATFGGELLHAGLPEQAAAYYFHLCANHPFVDGNKRAAVAASELFLVLNGSELDATDEELETLTLGIASGKTPKEQVVEFFRQYIADKQ